MTPSSHIWVNQSQTNNTLIFQNHQIAGTSTWVPKIMKIALALYLFFNRIPNAEGHALSVQNIDQPEFGLGMFFRGSEIFLFGFRNILSGSEIFFGFRDILSGQKYFLGSEIFCSVSESYLNCRPTLTLRTFLVKN